MQVKSFLQLTTFALFVAAVILSFGNRQNYRDDYIRLLEDRLTTDNVHVTPLTEPLDVYEIQRQLREIIDFACQDFNTIKSIKSRKNSPDEWAVMITLNTDSIDDFGEVYEERIFLTAVDNQGIVEILDMNELIEICR
jgi:hypothetical protein